MIVYTVSLRWYEKIFFKLFRATIVSVSQERMDEISGFIE